MDTLLTLEEAAARLRLHPRTMRRWLDEKGIPYIRIEGERGMIRIDPEKLDLWIRGQEINSGAGYYPLEKMKFLYLPLLNPAPGGASEQLDFIEALREEFSLETFDYMASPGAERELEEIFRRFRPDIVHGQYQENQDISPDCLRKLKDSSPDTVFSQWSGDVRARIMPQYVEMGKRGVDFNLLSNSGQIPMYEQAIGKPCFYWQNAIGGSFLVDPVPGEDIVFCGRNYHVPMSPQLSSFPLSPQRWEMVELLGQCFPDRFKLYGEGWPGGWAQRPIVWRDQTQIYQKAYCTVGQNHCDWKHYFSDRQLIAMAAGRPHVCQYTGGLEDIFEDGRDCLFWRTPQECVEKVQWLLDHPEEATQIGLQGRERVRKEHTWKVRIREYRGIVGIY